MMSLIHPLPLVVHQRNGQRRMHVDLWLWLAISPSLDITQTWNSYEMTYLFLSFTMIYNVPKFGFVYEKSHFSRRIVTNVNLSVSFACRANWNSKSKTKTKSQTCFDAINLAMSQICQTSYSWRAHFSR